MKLYTRKAVKRIAIGMFCIIVLAELYTLTEWYAVYQSQLCMVDDILKYYIESQHKFPSAEEDLMSVELLVFDGAQYAISFPPGEEEQDLHVCRIWQDLQIAYGIDCDTILLEDGRLFDIDTNAEVKLFSGPYQFLFNDVYADISMRLYDTLRSHVKDPCNMQ